MVIYGGGSIGDFTIYSKIKNMKNKNITQILTSRRLWAAICALVAVCLRATGVDVNFDTNRATDAIMALIQAIADLGAIILPLWSLSASKKIK